MKWASYTLYYIFPSNFLLSNVVRGDQCIFSQKSIGIVLKFTGSTRNLVYNGLIDINSMNTANFHYCNNLYKNCMIAATHYCVSDLPHRTILSTYRKFHWYANWDISHGSAAYSYAFTRNPMFFPCIPPATVQCGGEHFFQNEYDDEVYKILCQLVQRSRHRIISETAHLDKNSQKSQGLSVPKQTRPSTIAHSAPLHRVNMQELATSLGLQVGTDINKRCDYIKRAPKGTIKNVTKQLGMLESSVWRIAEELRVEIPDPRGIINERATWRDQRCLEVSLKSVKEEVLRSPHGNEG